MELAGLLTGVVLHLRINWGNNAILMELNLFIHVHGQSSHLIRSSLISFKDVCSFPCTLDFAFGSEKVDYHGRRLALCIQLLKSLIMK